MGAGAAQWRVVAIGDEATRGAWLAGAGDSAPARTVRRSVVSRDLQQARPTCSPGARELLT